MELEQCVNFILTKAQQSIQHLFKNELAPYGITPGQYAILKCLWDENAQTAKQLAGRLYLDSSTVTGILDRIEQKGLIERQPGLKDRRAIQVCLTSKGKELEKPVSQAIENANRKALLAFETTESENLKTLLQKLNPGD